MKNYLLGLLAVPLMSPLLSIASATEYSFTSGPQSYLNNEVVVSEEGNLSNISHTLKSWSTDGSFTLSTPSDGGGYETFCAYGEKDGVAGEVAGRITNCNGLTIPVGTYYVRTIGQNGYSGVPFETLSFTIGSSSSGGGGSDSDSGLPGLSVPGSFSSGLTQLVNNFGSTIVNWLPVVILITLGITAIFALFRVVRNYARRSFKG